MYQIYDTKIGQQSINPASIEYYCYHFMNIETLGSYIFQCPAGIGTRSKGFQTQNVTEQKYYNSYRGHDDLSSTKRFPRVVNRTHCAQQAYIYISAL